MLLFASSGPELKRLLDGRGKSALYDGVVSNFQYEYGNLSVSVEVVGDVHAAIAHINEFSR